MLIYKQLFTFSKERCSIKGIASIMRYLASSIRLHTPTTCVLKLSNVDSFYLVGRGSKCARCDLMIKHWKFSPGPYSPKYEDSWQYNTNKLFKCWCNLDVCGWLD